MIFSVKSILQQVFDQIVHHFSVLYYFICFIKFSAVVDITQEYRNDYQSNKLIQYIKIVLMEQQSIPIKEHWYRFVIITIYILAALVNSLPINTFSSTNSIVSREFDISLFDIALNTLIFPISHTLFSVPCNWILNKKGIRLGYYIAAALVSGGMWLRTLLSHQNFYVCLIGSFLSAVGGIFILNTPSRLAITWFKAQTVPIITFLGVLVNLVSMAISISIPGLIVNDQSSGDDIINFLRLEAIIATIPFVLLVILIRQKPAYPPSKGAIAANVISQDYCNLMKKIFLNFQYIKLAVSMSLNFGVCIALLAVMEPALVGLGYKNAAQAISVCGSSGIVIGLFSNIIYSYAVRKSKQYKRIINIAALGDFVGLVIWSVGYFFLMDKWWELIIISMIFCFNHFSIPSISILFSSEIAFPLDQASTAGYLLAASQTVGFLVGLIYASLLNDTQERSRLIFYITIACLFVAFVISLTIKQDLKRTHFQQGKELQQQIGEKSIKINEQGLLTT